MKPVTTAEIVFPAATFKLLLLTSPLAIVIILSFVVGLGMVVLFGYTSDQKAIKIAKDQLKAHLLAVRLFRDQLPVVVGSYGKILGGTGRYLRLAFKPLLYVIIPITLLIVQLDRYLGWKPLPENAPILLTVHVANSDVQNHISIDLPPAIFQTAPPVHVLAENEVVWRLSAAGDGDFEARVVADNESAAKTICVGSGLMRISPIRLRGHFWERMLSSGEAELPPGGPIDSIAITYPERSIEIAGYGINWIWLFFILSMIAGFIFKELLGIQI